MIETVQTFAGRRSTRRILVVDDNYDAAVSLAILLKLEGHEVQLAHDGIDAIAAAATWHPDLILLDIGLPGLNGYEVARKIRAEPWGQRIVVVAITGWGRDEDRLLSQEAGFDGHLVKPSDLDLVMELVAEVQSSRDALRPDRA